MMVRVNFSKNQNGKIPILLLRFISGGRRDAMIAMENLLWLIIF